LHSERLSAQLALIGVTTFTFKSRSGERDTEKKHEKIKSTAEGEKEKKKQKAKKQTDQIPCEHGLGVHTEWLATKGIKRISKRKEKKRNRR
jgi:hypothetical protein